MVNTSNNSNDDKQQRLKRQRLLLIIIIIIIIIKGTRTLPCPDHSLCLHQAMDPVRDLFLVRLGAASSVCVCEIVCVRVCGLKVHLA